MNNDTYLKELLDIYPQLLPVKSEIAKAAGMFD